MFRVAHNYQTKLEVSCDDFSGPSLPPGGSSSVSVNRVTLRVPPPRPTTMDPKPLSIRILFVYTHAISGIEVQVMLIEIPDGQGLGSTYLSVIS